MRNAHNAKVLTFKELVDFHASFHMGKAYVPTVGKLGVKIFREFESRGKRWHFCGEGRASRANYGHFMPAAELTE